MARPTMKDDQYKHLLDVAVALGMSDGQVLRRIKKRILPKPTKIGTNGVRLFDDAWVEEAKRRMGMKA